MNRPIEMLSGLLSAAFCEALAERGVELTAEQVDPVLQRSARADFQANGAMGLGKRFGLVPRELAEAVAECLRADEAIADVEVAGPGFLNLTLSDVFLSSEVSRLMAHPRLGFVPSKPYTAVVDYSSPNVAKEMHVGHLRSTVIGDACVRLLEWAGHTVIRRNHIGDWGTPFGMLIEHMEDLGEDGASSALSLGDLNTFYRAARAKFDADEPFRERARARVVALQSGDPDTLHAWTLLIEQSRRYFLEVYAKLDVRLDGSEFRGESAYNDRLQDVVDELQAADALTISDGAECLYLDGFVTREGDPLPLIVRKGDGGFGYAATDLAALRERTRELDATRLLYVVGAPQGQHFRMIFAAGERIGWLHAGTRAEHVAFGSVLGTNGKMLASRSGETVKLVALLDEAIDRAAAVVVERSPSIESGERDAIARAVGIGAVKYADLSTERTRDYVFDLERMLALEGNTAPYLQYANARINSLLRDADVDLGGPVLIVEPTEHELALALLAFADIVGELVDSLLFHRLTGYLFELATAFSRFYATCPVLKAETLESRDSRLRLAALVGLTLRTGLSLLGIRAPERL